MSKFIFDICHSKVEIQSKKLWLIYLLTVYPISFWKSYIILLQNKILPYIRISNYIVVSVNTLYYANIKVRVNDVKSFYFEINAEQLQTAYSWRLSECRPKLQMIWVTVRIQLNDKGTEAIRPLLVVHNCYPWAGRG